VQDDKMTKRISTLVLLSSVTTAGLCVSIGCDSRITRSPRLESMQQLITIGLAIRDFTNDNVLFPKDFTCLVPQYIPYEQIGVFFAPTSSVPSRSAVLDWSTNLALLTQYSSYIYVGTNMAHDFLAYERPGLWKVGSGFTGRLAVLYKDFHTQMLPTQYLHHIISPQQPQADTTR